MNTAYEERLLRSLMNYDHNYDPELDFYNSLPYTRDVVACNWEHPQLFSGNIIKYYRYKVGEPFVVKIPDVEFEIPAYRLSIVDVDTISEETIDDDTALLLEDNEITDNMFEEDDLTY